MWEYRDLILALQSDDMSKHNGAMTINRVVIDSRNTSQNNVFIGINGKNYNGSKFAKQAMDNGAALCIVDHVPSDCANYENKLLVINDTYHDGLLRLATYNRNVKHCKSTFIGITGSIGKTTTKEMLKIALLGISKYVYANEGNKNNQYGLPLSIANIDSFSLDYGVFEIGMSAAGEISYLSNILKPHIGVITGIAPAHLVSFDSADSIATEKSELLYNIGDNGYAVVNIGSICGDILLKHAYINTIARNIRICTYSYESEIECDVWCSVNMIHLRNITVGNDIKVRVTAKYTIVSMHISEQITYDIGCIGKQFIENSLAILGVLVCNIIGRNTSIANSKMIIQNGMYKLQDFQALCGRGAISFVNGRSIIVLDESYNSNPASLTAALYHLNDYVMHLEHRMRYRKVAIIGDMLELGADEVKLHMNMLMVIKECNIDAVFCVGERMKYLFDTLPSTVLSLWAADAFSMLKIIDEYIRPYDVIMIKGSNSMKMQEIYNHIITCIK